jgi:hypothetical protein
VTHTHHHEAPGEIPVLDIGGDVGALLVYLDHPTPSGELQARPLGEPDRRFHTGVHLRQLFGHRVYVALYPEVVAGVYELLDDDLVPFATVEVAGGAVSELDLRRVSLSAR